LVLLTEAEPGRRNRRTIDGILLALTAIVVGLAAVVANSVPEIDEQVAEAFVTILGWAGALWRVVFVSALVLALAITLDVLFRRRWALLRDVVLALGVVLGLGSLLGRAVEADWLPVDGHVLSAWGFPELRLAAVAAVLVVAGPELVRPVRLVAIWLVLLAALGAVALEASLPAGVLAGLSLGLGAAAVVRLLFGSAAGVPKAETIRAALTALGVETTDLRAADRQRLGAAEYVGHANGKPIKARVLGRDAQDTQRVARRWRLLAYRDPPHGVAIGRLEQVEHEALATLMARSAGIRAPDVVTAALGPSGDAILVTEQPDVASLEEAAEVSDDLLRDLWGQVAKLHGAGISHGRLNASNVAVVDGAPMLVGLAEATLGAPQSALDIDVAELLVACAVLVGSDRALDAAVAGAGVEAVAGALPYLQRAALTPHVRDLARHEDVELAELRTAAAKAAGTEVPDIAPLRRFRARDLVLTGAIGFAAYLLITQLAEIGFGTIVDELSEANVAWVVLALILAQTTFVTQAISLRGAVATPLALLPCVVLEAAVKFINLTVPSSAGRIAINVRFLQKMGAPPGEAVAAGAVDGIAETVIQIVLVLALLAFVDIDLDAKSFGGMVPSSDTVTAIFGVLILSVVVVMAVPSLRAKVVPQFRGGLSSLWAVARTRSKRIELFGGNLATELIFAVTLGAVCHAYGVDLTFAKLLFINLTASALAGLLPVPGGIGAAEAGLTAGLVAVGVNDSTAFAIALTHRLCTYYLPPIWGYVALQWLSRRDYV
jgi:uncharacterized membrane protein YbhN (UPF0104 family)/tRNA A-37 threonylcarbamoyl transferase component Bud32